MRLVVGGLVAALLGWQPMGAADRKLTPEERIELFRGLTAEFATVKTPLPRSKKPLIFQSAGSFDKGLWERIGKESGPAARVGDAIQITKVTIESDRIVFELNGGFRSGPKWYERIQLGTSTRTVPIGSGTQPMAVAGTTLALVFPGRMPPISSDKVKEMLAPVLDFNKRSPTELYVEALPPAVQQAIKDKKAVEGMDRDQVTLALGKPGNKIRETVDGAEQEDWIYGLPPHVLMVTFDGDQVVKVKQY